MSFHRCQVVHAVPPETNNAGINITKTKGEIGPHPIISTDAAAKNLTGVMVQTFGNSSRLPETALNPVLYKWFLPVFPAPMESIHNPIPTRKGGSLAAEWVNFKDKLLFADRDIVCSDFNCPLNAQQ